MKRQRNESSTPTDKRVVLAFLNAFTEGISGGDAWFIEVAKRLPEVEWIVVTSKLGRELCIRGGLNAEYLISSDEESFGGVLKTYLRRTRVGLRLTRGVIADVVLATSDAPPDVIPAIWYKIRSQKRHVEYIQKVYHIIPFRPSRIFAWLVQAGMLTFVSLSANSVATVSKKLKEQLRHRGMRESKIFVTKPGATLPDSFKNETDVAFQRTLSTYNALYVGRLNPTKGVLQLPTIWSKVVTMSPQARLAIVGHGNDEMVRLIQTSIKDLKLGDSVSLLGHLPEEVVWELRRQVSIFVSPSHEEGFGMAILEAMAAGLPTIAWNLEIYRESFDQGILLISEDNLEDFARTVVDLLSNDEWRSALAVEARQCATRFNWDATARAEYATFFAPQSQLSAD